MRLPLALAVLSVAGATVATPAHAQGVRTASVGARQPASRDAPSRFGRGVAGAPRLALAPAPAPQSAPKGRRSAGRILLHTAVGALAGGALGAWAGHEMHQRMAYIGPDPGRHRRWMLRLGAGGATAGGLVGTVIGMAREARTDNVVPALPAGRRGVNGRTDG